MVNAVVLCSFAFFTLTSIVTPGAGFAWVLILFYLIWFAVAPSFILRNSVKRFPWLFEEARYRFTEAQFSVDRSSTQVSTAWMNIQSVVAFHGAYLIFLDRGLFYSVPKRFFAPGQASEFDTLLSRVLAAHRKPSLIHPNSVWERLCYGDRQPPS